MNKAAVEFRTCVTCTRLEPRIPHAGHRRDGVIPGCIPVLQRAPRVSQAQLQNNNGAGWPTLAFEDIGARSRGETDEQPR